MFLWNFLSGSSLKGMQFCGAASRCHCVSISEAGTHAVCSRVRSSPGCTCTPHRRHCTGHRCDSYTSWDNQDPSVQRDTLQMPERQSAAGSHRPSSHNLIINTYSAHTSDCMKLAFTLNQLCNIWADARVRLRSPKQSIRSMVWMTSFLSLVISL